MKKIIGMTVFALLLVSSTASAAVSTAPGQNKLLCFDGHSEGGIYGGNCTLKGNGARGPATLDNTDGDTDGSFSGVYIEATTLTGALLGEIGKLSFTYTATATAGAPRISLPVDTDNDSDTDLYAFASAYYCSDGAGLVDVIHDSTCTIYVGDESFANWSAMVQAHPEWTVADDYTFVIADEVGIWTVGGVKLGR